MGPTLVALTFAGVAHAQGAMDFSGTQTLMGTFNTRFAYVSTSRASHDAHIYTNDAPSLREALSRDVTKASAFEFRDRLRPFKGVSVEHGVGMPGAQDSGLGSAI